MNTVLKQGLPIGCQSFAVLRSENALYVDKTGYFERLVEDATTRQCFLSRPRRFGKSLMISTLEAMFQGKIELFKGLAAEAWVSKCATCSSPVLHFDMSSMSTRSVEKFECSLLNRISRQAISYGVKLSGSVSSVEDAFSELIEELYRKSGPVVILIDEYDVPILDNISDDLEIIEAFRRILYSFYRVLKSNDQYLRFVMLTGITKFSKLSIFSALNNLKDISMDSRWGALVGFTQEELEINFGAWLDDFARLKGILRSEVIQCMRDYYDVFCFDGEHHVYNPWSVLNCLDEKKFSNYWYETTTPSYLVKSLKKFGMDSLDVYENFVVDKDFTSASEIEHATPESFLYQAGYLTIKRSEGSSLVLDYPNWEVRESISKTYLEHSYGVKNFRSIGERLFLVLSRNDVSSVESLFNEALMAVSYETLGKAGNGESLYHSLFAMLLTTAGVIAPSEVQNAVGRADIVAFVGNFVYIMELKTVSDKADVPEVVDSAMKQIDGRQYAVQFWEKGKTVISIVVVINVEEKQCFMKEI